MPLPQQRPFSVVPSEDTNGHGTFLAGVAGGSTVPGPIFNGVPGKYAGCCKIKRSKTVFKNTFLADGRSRHIRAQI